MWTGSVLQTGLQLWQKGSRSGRGRSRRLCDDRCTFTGSEENGNEEQNLHGRTECKTYRNEHVRHARFHPLVPRPERSEEGEHDVGGKFDSDANGGDERYSGYRIHLNAE